MYVRMDPSISLELATHLDPAAKLYNKCTSRTNYTKRGREVVACGG